MAGKFVTPFDVYRANPATSPGTRDHEKQGEHHVG